MTNQYMRNLLHVWRANQDVQYCLDGLTLEGMRPFTDIWKEIEGRSRAEWTKSQRDDFEKRKRQLKHKFVKHGVYFELLMVCGGVLRKLLDVDSREDLLADFVPLPERRSTVRELLERLSLSISVLRARSPAAIHPIATLKEEIFVPLGKCLAACWPEIPFRPYMHVHIE